jgi:hypothetical protein
VLCEDLSFGRWIQRFFVKTRRRVTSFPWGKSMPACRRIA